MGEVGVEHIFRRDASFPSVTHEANKYQHPNGTQPTLALKISRTKNNGDQNEREREKRSTTISVVFYPYIPFTFFFNTLAGFQTI